MRPRKTVRVLLLDPADRLLLIQMQDPNVSDASGRVLRDAYWVTIGGACEPGEDIATTARREVLEETGMTDIRLGPAVWTTEHVLCIHGKSRLMQETFFFARTDTTAISSDGWTALERRVIHTMRWWSLIDLRETSETIFPRSLAQHLPDLIEGVMPASPITIAP